MLRALLPVALIMIGIALIIVGLDLPTMVRVSACPDGTVAMRDVSSKIHCVVVKK